MIRLTLIVIVLVIIWTHKTIAGLIGLAIVAWLVTLLRRPMHRWHALELVALGWALAKLPAWLRNEWLRGKKQEDYETRHDLHMEKEEAKHANNRNATTEPAWQPRVVRQRDEPPY